MGALNETLEEQRKRFSEHAPGLLSSRGVFLILREQENAQHAYDEIARQMSRIIRADGDLKLIEAMRYARDHMAGRVARCNRIMRRHRLAQIEQLRVHYAMQPEKE